MNPYHDILLSLLWRLVPALGLGGFGWRLLATAQGGFDAVPRLLAGMGCFLVAALILAPAIARLIAEPAGTLYHPTEQLDRPPPLYSIGETRRKSGLHQEAFDYFAKIAEDYPEELKPYVEMIDIAIRDLKKPELADEVLRKGLEAPLSDHDKDALRVMHKGIASRFNSEDRYKHEPIKIKPAKGAEGERPREP